ncbi:uncharacterized protein LOC125500726 [Athalia rosae]|uniref:uncharacterized protein LOC125500726 n=1 Tax=Athalia rosae TaxID=37344 RepID=UPI0020344CBB|nr:uncharacterized protein LOC125500726 [Athalia rosae]
MVGDIVRLYDQLKTDPGQPCGRDKDAVDYYDVLLKQIDDEIKGPPSGQNDLVNFLVGRLTQDLRKVPKMEHIFKLKPEQQHLKILEILRQKLVVRQQEEKRRYLLAEMEECMMASTAASDSCMGRSEETTESMWKLAVTRSPAETDVTRLFSTYPVEAVGAFLDIIAEDRQAILVRKQRGEKNQIDSMRAEVYKEVQFGKAEYNKARAMYREWNDILSNVEEIMYLITNEAMDEVPKHNEELLTNMVTNIKQTEKLVIEEAQRGEMLTEKIADANEWKFSVCDDDGKNASWDMKNVIDNMRDEVESYKLLIQNQRQRIEQLRDQLDYQ